MRTLKIRYAGAWNFLPFGPEGIEIYFDKLGNVVFVRGENRDVKPIDTKLPSDEVRVSSNGTGKSTLQEILCWAFYGKTIKSPSKIKVDGVIHNLIGKKCKVAVEVDNYRIERGRKPNFLRLWKDGHEETQGDMRVIQKKIEQTVIGLSYDAFVNICVFTDDQSSCFLECDTGTKREIVENLLSLEIYRHRHETANDEIKALKTSIKSLSREYEIILGTAKDAERRVEHTSQKEKDWKVAKENELKQIMEKIREKTKDLQSSDSGPAILAYQKAQEQIAKISPQITVLEEKQESRRRILSEARIKESAVKEEVRGIAESVHACQSVVKEYQVKIKVQEKFIADLSANDPGTKCDHCWGIVDEANYEPACKHAEREISQGRQAINSEMAKVKELTEQVNRVKTKQDRIKQAIADGEVKLSEGDLQLRKLRAELVAASQVREPKANSVELLLQQQIEQLKENGRAKKAEANGPSPFVDILINDMAELAKITKTCESKELEVKDAERQVPYYEYWLKAYGDKGIRKWVIDGIIPSLNNRIAYWLQFLIDNKITLKFDSYLNEVIERNPADGDPYIYHAMSAGQRRRINLAVSQAFADIMMISIGTVPSLVFLDEVTTNIDPLGVQGIYNMIGELAEDKQVFVTTHDPDLIRMLRGSDMISLVHENGITRIDDK